MPRAIFCTSFWQMRRNLDERSSGFLLLNLAESPSGHITLTRSPSHFLPLVPSLSHTITHSQIRRSSPAAQTLSDHISSTSISWLQNYCNGPSSLAITTKSYISVYVCTNYYIPICFCLSTATRSLHFYSSHSNYQLHPYCIHTLEPITPSLSPEKEKCIVSLHNQQLHDPPSPSPFAHISSHPVFFFILKHYIVFLLLPFYPLLLVRFHLKQHFPLSRSIMLPW